MPDPMPRAADLDWFDFVARARDGAPAILAIGSFEQHGPHLPLGTDTTIAAALADGVAARCGGMVLPPLSFGAPSRPLSGGGDLFAAPALDLPTLMTTVESIARGCFEAGARRLVTISWHLENAAVLWDSLRSAVLAHRDAQAILFGAPWALIDDDTLSGLTADGTTEIDWPADHAGLLETALMRAIAPEQVGDPPAPAPFRPRAYEVLPTPADAVPATGVVNDARGVDARMGRDCLDQMTTGIAAAIASEPAG